MTGSAICWLGWPVHTEFMMSEAYSWLSLISTALCPAQRFRGAAGHSPAGDRADKEGPSDYRDGQSPLGVTWKIGLGSGWRRPEWRPLCAKSRHSMPGRPLAEIKVRDGGSPP